MVKMVPRFVCLFVLLQVYVLEAAKLPSYITPCKRTSETFTQCLVNTANDLIHSLDHDETTLHIPKMLPLEIPYMYLDFGKDLIIELWNGTVYGLEDAEVQNMDFKINEGNVTSSFDLYVPRLNFVGDYDIRGKIFMLPIQGQGPCNITYVKGTYHFHPYMEIVEKKGKRYLIPKKTSLNYETERSHFQMDNLFGGDKVLGEQMNIFLNENWKEVNEELGAKIGDAYGEMYTEITKYMFSKIPFDDLFPAD